MEISPSNRKLVIGELIKGREFALQLSTLWQKTLPGELSLVIGGQFEEVISSFSRALDVLGYKNSMDAGENSGGDLISVDEVKNENDGKKRKNSSAARGGSRRYLFIFYNFFVH